MADNATIVGAGGTSYVIATDEIGGIHNQIYKIAFGVLDSSTLVSTTNPLPVADMGIARTTAPTPVAAGSRVDNWSDVFGRTVVSDFDPEVNLASGMTVLRDRLIAQRYTVLADSIADGFAPIWTFTNAGLGSSAVMQGEGLVQSGAAAGSSAQMVSLAPIYLPGQQTWLNSAIRFGDTGVAGNDRRIGNCTALGTVPQDGAYYELTDTTFNAVTVRGGVATAVAVGAWSRNAAAPFTLDTSYHQFEIRWTANSIHFLVDNVLRHVASGGALPITNTLNFPIMLQSLNRTATSNCVIAVRNIGIGRFGTPESQGPAGALSLAKLQGTLYAAGDAGAALMAVRRASPSVSTALEGGYEPLQISNGRLWTTARIDAAPPLEELLTSILTELRVTNTMLQIGLSVKDDPSDLRDDIIRQLN